jgi:multiple sugar transport system substrate-binding protein
LTTRSTATGARAPVPRHTRLRAPALLTAAVLGAGVLAACGDDDGTPTLTWYINPDTGGQARIAQECTDEAEGAYRITTSILPNDADGQREQLIRRLSANDTGIDLMSLDPPFVPEFAEAGFLLELPDDLQEELTSDVVESAVTGATWRDEIVAAPFWANTQLLWFRESVAEAAGLDMEQPVTWDQLVEAAEQQDATIGVQGNRYEGYVVWINALVASAGGQIIENPEAAPEELQAGVESEAGTTAAQIIRDVTAGGLAGGGVTTADEEASRALFQGDSGGFMVNWPYVWAAFAAGVEGGQLDEAFIDDVGWAVYPQAVEGEEAAPPFGGILLGIGAYTEYPDEALEALTCIVAPEKQAAYMVSDGNPAASIEAYEDPEVQETFPMADAILESLQQAQPRPQTPYYGEVSGSLQRTWHPPTSLNPDTAPAAADDLIVGVIRGESLL